MSSIAVLINVCNHREQALECLAGCYRQFDTLAAQDESLSFSRRSGNAFPRCT